MCASSAIKYILFVFNLLICIGGLVLLSMGAYLMMQLKGSSDARINGVAIGLIVIGACVFLIAFLGCCGAIQESTCMLSVFGQLLSFFFLAQLVCAILIFVYQDQFKVLVREHLQKAMSEYNEKESSKVLWDDLQKNFRCCGVDGATDWIVHTLTPPASCVCSERSGKCRSEAAFGVIFTEGCYQKVANTLVNSGNLLAAIAIGLAVAELIGAIFAFRLASKIKRQGHGF